MLENNNVYCGDCLDLMEKMEENSVDLVITSPPYYNAKAYSQYENYVTYLSFLESVFRKGYRILKEGRFCCVNLSCIIEARENRQSESKRYPIPFHFVSIMEKIGFKFLEDIIWKKPEGAVKNRNGGFFRHRKPLAWKPNIVTEYILVFQKPCDGLIDDMIRKCPKEIMENSLIQTDYERTNVWEIQPARCKYHPAEFPLEIPSKLISYYSFVGDLVLDMFNGYGTTCIAAKQLKRNYIGIDKEKYYVELSEKRLLSG